MLSKAAIDDPAFTILQCVDALVHSSDNIGLHHYLVGRLGTYPYDQLEFLVPQLVQLVVLVSTLLLALEEFLLAQCETHPHFSILTFWTLQSHLAQVALDPELYAFRTTRKMINLLQNVLFNGTGPMFRKEAPMRENMYPSVVLAGMVAGIVGLPGMGTHALPLIKTQGRAERSMMLRLANYQKALTQNLTRKNRKAAGAGDLGGEEPVRINTGIRRAKSLYGPSGGNYSTGAIDDSIKGVLVPNKSLPNIHRDESPHDPARRSILSVLLEIVMSTPTSPTSALNRANSTSAAPSARSLRPIPYDFLTPTQRRHSLATNYFQKELLLFSTLASISHRLLQVPREARLTTLRAELALCNRALPAEVDIPLLLPKGSSMRPRFHKLLKINLSEAAVLNLAERVPFLLYIEYLTDEFDFDTDLPENRKIIEREQQGSKKEEPAAEADLGDVSVVSIVNRRLESASRPATPEVETLNASGITTATTPDSAGVLAEQIRIATVMLQQLGTTGTQHSTAISQRIISNMQLLQDRFEHVPLPPPLPQDADAGNRKLENDILVTGNSYLGETWQAKRAKIRKNLPYGHLPNWELCLVIVKSGDDLTQEAFACQLIQMMLDMWKRLGIAVWTKQMRILCTSHVDGIVQTITDALLIHSIKKTLYEMKVAGGENPKTPYVSLAEHFERSYGEASSPRHRQAVDNFVKSLAAYLVACYVLQIKDRHNGNIMLDNDGHLVHIDFGFLLLNLPGGVGFEAAPFKLPLEWVELMGGVDSAVFAEFKSLVKQCFLCVCENATELVAMVELMQRDSSLPCFGSGENTSELLKQRLMPAASAEERGTFVEQVLIGRSIGSNYTRLYDQFQLITQGIYV